MLRWIYAQFDVNKQTRGKWRNERRNKKNIQNEISPLVCAELSWAVRCVCVILNIFLTAIMCVACCKRVRGFDMRFSAACLYISLLLSLFSLELHDTFCISAIIATEPHIRSRYRLREWTQEWMSEWVTGRRLMIVNITKVKERERVRTFFFSNGNCQFNDRLIIIRVTEDTISCVSASQSTNFRSFSRCGDFISIHQTKWSFSFGLRCALSND